MKEIGKPFEDINSYNNSMSKAMEDKLFFVDKLPEDNFLFVDFGCADGTMIRHLVEIFGKKHTYVGYDCSESMISLAKTKYDLDSDYDVRFTTDWEDVKKAMEENQEKKSALILSSVIHEVYSYLNESEVKLFWERVKNSGFDFIIIRDMMARRSMERQSSTYDVCRIMSHGGDMVKMSEQFEKVHGYLGNQKNLIHFLLKYRWTINWDRELHENYFPIYLDELLGIIKEPPYMLVYLESFKVEFLKTKIYEDLGITLEDDTHIKLIFKKS